MRAVVYDGPRNFSIREVPTPEPGPGEVLIRIVETGVCGTDLHIHEGGFYAAFPLIPGHEPVGRVEALGEGVTGFAIGESVTVNPNVPCGHCGYCQRGQRLVCPNLKGVGTNFPGTFAEYMTMRYEYVYSTEGMADDVAVFTEPTSCVVHGVHVANPRPGSSALVFGAGPTGLLLAQQLQAGGCASVTVAASSRFKLDRAQQLGVDDTVLLDRGDLDAGVEELRRRSDGGFDLVVEATASTAIGDACVPLTRNGGTVLLYGVTDAADRLAISSYDVFRREISIKGSFAQVDDFPGAIATLRSGRVRTDGIITHRYKLEEYDQALEALRSDRTVHKIVLVP